MKEGKAETPLIYSSPCFVAHRSHGRTVAKDVRVAAHEGAHAILRWHNLRSINRIQRQGSTAERSTVAYRSMPLVLFRE
jgi:hypothetical protein